MHVVDAQFGLPVSRLGHTRSWMGTPNEIHSPQTASVPATKLSTATPPLWHTDGYEWDSDHNNPL